MCLVSRVLKVKVGCKYSGMEIGVKELAYLYLGERLGSE